MKDKLSTLEPSFFYHIYNRANGNEDLFTYRENYIYFLSLYKRYVSPYVNTYSYCLMPNHFHFLIQVKDLHVFHKEPKILSAKFSAFFNSYSKSFNKQEGRKGSLFMRPYKRKKITDSGYLIRLIHYIHSNPIEASLVKNPEEWSFSSYSGILSNSKTLLCREEVLELFDSKENFKFVHRNVSDLDDEMLLP